MRKATVIVFFSLLFFALFKNISLCSAQKEKIQNVSIAIKSADFNNDEKNKIKNKMLEIFNRSSKVKVVSVGKSNQSVTGLALKTRNLKVITITLKDQKTGNTFNASASCNGSFDKFLNTSVKEAANKILRHI